MKTRPNSTNFEINAEDKTRRDFLKGAVLSAAALPLFTSKMIARTGDECEEKIESAVVRSKIRDMAEKALLFKSLVKKFGKGIIETLQDTVIKDTKIKLEKRNIPVRNIDAVVDNLWIDPKPYLEIEIEQRTKENLKIRVNKCIFAQEMRKNDAADIGFALYCCYDYGFCTGLNPKIKFTRTKTLMMGDDHCNHTYELKE
jgi:hypothetical protein